MGFGVFKKLKDKIKKIKSWLKDSLPKARTIMNQSAPIVKDILQDTNFNKAFDIANDGIVAADEAINKKNYSNITDWTKTNIIPKLKSQFNLEQN